MVYEGKCDKCTTELLTGIRSPSLGGLAQRSNEHFNGLRDGDTNIFILRHLVISHPDTCKDELSMC